MSDDSLAATVAARCKDVGHEFACRFPYGSCVGCLPKDGLRCWTCGTAMPEDAYRMAPREPEPHEDKRTCEACHYAVEFHDNALQLMNMVRYAAGLPTIACLDCERTGKDGCRKCGGSGNGS